MNSFSLGMLAPFRELRRIGRFAQNALVNPPPRAEIAKHCGVSKDTVHQVISRYNRFGVAAVQTPGKGGHHHEYLTVEQEHELSVSGYD